MAVKFDILTNQTYGDQTDVTSRWVAMHHTVAVLIMYKDTSLHRCGTK